MKKELFIIALALGAALAVTTIAQGAQPQAPPLAQATHCGCCDGEDCTCGGGCDCTTLVSHRNSRGVAQAPAPQPAAPCQQAPRLAYRIDQAPPMMPLREPTVTYYYEQPSYSQPVYYPPPSYYPPMQYATYGGGYSGGYGGGGGNCSGSSCGGGRRR